MDKVRVLVALDHVLSRRAVHALLNAQADMEIVGDCTSPAELLVRVAESSPQIVLTDAFWSDPNSIALVGQVRKVCPTSRILLITISSDIEMMRKILDAGASGCIGRHADEAQVLTAIRELHQGHVFMDPELADGVFQNVLVYRCMIHSGHNTRIGKRLSPREHQVLRYLLKGYTNQQIADNLFLSVKTTETYRARLKRKLGLRNRADIVRYGI